MNPILLMLPAIGLLSVGQENWLDARAEAEREFRLATQDIKLPATLRVLKTIYTVPVSDGRVLYDLIVSNGYRRLLDVGTGRGASALWMALAATRTGGKVVTIEYNPKIAQSARDNFENSEVSELIRLVVGDVRHELDRMPGDFDLVFVDIGSTNAQLLLERLYPRVARGGAIVVHDVLANGLETGYVRFVRSLPGLQTAILKASTRGLAVSIKTE